VDCKFKGQTVVVIAISLKKMRFRVPRYIRAGGTKKRKHYVKSTNLANVCLHAIKLFLTPFIRNNREIPRCAQSKEHIALAA
jgi:hypothetical protein